MSINKLTTVFWDLDGTIADTEMYGHRLAFNKAFKNFGLDWNWDMGLYKNLLSISGGKRRIEYFARKNQNSLTLSDIQTIHGLKQNLYVELLEEKPIPLRNGVFRLLNELKNNNVNQWLVTTSGIKAVEALLKKSLSSYNDIFKGIITFEDVLNHKPHPEAYLEAINRSREDPNSILVIEDSLIGLKSSTAADLKCLVTMTSWNLNNFNKSDFSAAKSVVDTLGDENQTVNALYGLKPKLPYIDFHYLMELIN